MTHVHKIHPSLVDLAISLSQLTPLPNNPRKGDVDAIMASYDEFGQVKPIVIQPHDDGTATVIAGNHQTEAARRLGWTHIAAVPMNTDDKRALAFALAENRTMELGHTDPVLLHDAVISVLDDYIQTFEALGWDDFQLAAMEEQVEHLTDSANEPSGYVPPVMISQPEDVEPEVSPRPTAPSEPSHIDAPVGINSHEAVTRGSSSVGAAGTRAVVQYMLVFEDADQQKRWYDFLRWLRSDAAIEGETTAEKLLYFLDSHADY
jgi:hypothetical protein